MGVSKRRGKRLKFNSDDFYRKTNTFTLLFLVILILLLINFSKILAVVGENEIERSYVTGNVAGSLNITVTEDPNAETEDTNDTTSEVVAAATTERYK